jgi:hypothetical protein
LQDEAIAVVGTYIRQVNLGDSLKSQANLTEKTLMGYLKSAATLYHSYAGAPLSLYVPAPTGGEAKLHPFLANILQQRTAWKQPKQKREPFTMAMFEALSDELSLQHQHNNLVFLSKAFAVFDWMGLGIHTGSRLGEYGQSKPKAGEPFATVPNSTDAREWAGTPLAFVREDFQFFGSTLIQHPYLECLQDHSLALYVHIRFRFDKSKMNFSIRKFKRLSGIMLCPVKRALSILKRADLLGIPPNYPIGAFCPHGGATGTFTMIKGDHIQSVMRHACRQAYPDPNHYLRLNIKLLMSHSNRITAAVALYNAKVPIPVIAFRFRWCIDSVTFYLRDCFKAIGPLTEAAIHGAYLN